MDEWKRRNITRVLCRVSSVTNTKCLQAICWWSY